MNELDTRKSILEWITKAIGDLDQARIRITVMDVNRTHCIPGQDHFYLEVYRLLSSAKVRVKEAESCFQQLDSTVKQEVVENPGEAVAEPVANS